MGGMTFGVLAMAYGTPATREEIEPYYTHIRRGRPPESHQLAELVARYAAIGGLSPLAAITERQARGLERALNDLGPEAPYRVYTGMKHAHPLIAETIDEMVNDGIVKAVGVVLAPHYSTMSVAVYNQNAQEAVDKTGRIALACVESWHMQPLFLESTARRVRQALEQLPESNRARAPIVFTAHSLPQRILAVNDPYPAQIEQSARAVAQKVNHDHWLCGWQSAGRTPEPWLGPDLLDVIRQLHDQGVRGMVVCPIGFVSDHLEVLYDIDVEAKGLADKLGMTLVRSASPNDEELFMRAIAAAVLEKAAEVR